MANIHSTFIEFNDIIRLHSDKKNELIRNRNTLRRKIKNYFKENKPDEVTPKFCGQGSYMTKTVINPTPEEIDNGDGTTTVLNKYDLDDGVYFLDNADNRKGTDTYHSWIINAVKTHNIKEVKSKNTCVRAIYSDGHHIDLPIYFKDKEDSNSIPQLAHRSNGFIDSDPKAFYEWFNDSCQEQLKRITRYLKAWRDHQNSKNSTKLVNGLILSILAKNNYQADERDDIAFFKTLEKIQETLENNGFNCYRPTPKKNEDLLEVYSENHFMERLSQLIQSGKKALDEDSHKNACKKWQKHLGNRFPCSNIEDDKEDKSYSRPATFTVNAGSAK